MLGAFTLSRFMLKQYQVDGRDYQILCLAVFLILGIYWRDWTFNPLTVPCLLFTCCATQAVWSSFQSVNWKSPVITALGLSLLLRSSHIWVFIFAGIVAISSKFILQTKDKHWFNPANFGIIAALCFTKDAWVSPGQWGSDVWLALIFLALGGIVLQKVGRLETSCAFFFTYGCLVLLRNFYLGWTIDVFVHQMTSGSLLLFALFMLTDPRSIPNDRQMRILWSALIAVLGFILQFGFYQSAGVFYALFLVSPLTILLDRLKNAPRFVWHGQHKLSTITNI